MPAFPAKTFCSLFPASHPQIRYPNGPQNAAEAAKARVGQRFYEVLFAGYTSKQWDEDPTNLAAEITQRIPVHYNSDARYFPDAYQALPEGGFSAFIDGLLDHPLIATHTNVDYFDSPLRHVKFKHLYFTGPIDRYFADQGLPPLQYRSLRFRKVAVPLAEQPANSVVNQPRRDVPHTRAMDYGQLPWSARWRGNQSVDTTTIVYECKFEETCCTACVRACGPKLLFRSCFRWRSVLSAAEQSQHRVVRSVRRAGATRGAEKQRGVCGPPGQLQILQHGRGH